MDVVEAIRAILGGQICGCLLHFFVFSNRLGYFFAISCLNSSSLLGFDDGFVAADREINWPSVDDCTSSKGLSRSVGLPLAWFLISEIKCRKNPSRFGLFGSAIGANQLASRPEAEVAFAFIPVASPGASGS